MALSPEKTINRISASFFIHRPRIVKILLYEAKQPMSCTLLHATLGSFYHPLAEGGVSRDAIPEESYRSDRWETSGGIAARTNMQ
jgi:hypothetical protein